jgi:hypothetical protein
LLYLAVGFMRTIIYVDGFNLYWRLLEKRPALRWLNIKALAEKLLRPANIVTGVRYDTAHISGRGDPTAPARQQLYLDALRTLPEVTTVGPGPDRVRDLVRSPLPRTETSGRCSGG